MKTLIPEIKLHAALIAVLLLWGIAGGAIVPATPWLLIFLAGAAAYVWFCVRKVRAHVRKPSPGKAGKDYPEEQRKWVRDTIRHWAGTMDAVGLMIEIPNKNPELPARQVLPELVAHRPVPVGVVLVVMPAAGKQSVDDLLAAQGNLESIWGYSLRMAKTGPAAVEITVEFSAPLEESRAADDWMESRNAL